MNQITLKSVKSQMKLPPEMQKAYTVVIKNGLKMLTDESMTEFVVEQLQGDNVPEKLGDGVAYMMVMLFKQSNGTIPPQLLIPAGIELLMHAVDVIQRTGDTITDQEIAEAMGNFMESMFLAVKGDKEALQTADSGLTPQGA